MSEWHVNYAKHQRAHNKYIMLSNITSDSIYYPQVVAMADYSFLK